MIVDRQCVAQSHRGSRCTRTRTVYVEGHFVCTQHNSSGWIPYFKADPPDPRAAERARAVLELGEDPWSKRRR